MLKRSIHFGVTISVLSLALLSCSKMKGGDNPDSSGNDHSNEPQVPSTIVEENVFKVDFLTDLGENPYMEGHTVEEIQHFIQHTQGKKAVVTMIDCLNFEVGKVQPLVKLAKNLSCQPFFAQTSRTTSDHIPGTGILTVYPVADYDGAVADDEGFISGCEIRIPLKQPQEVTFYTTKIRKSEQASAIVKSVNGRIHAHGVIVGTVAKGLADDLKQYFETKVGCRCELAGSSSTEYDLFVATPLEYVCRKIGVRADAGKTGHFCISIEKLI